MYTTALQIVCQRYIHITTHLRCGGGDGDSGAAIAGDGSGGGGDGDGDGGDISGFIKLQIINDNFIAYAQTIIPFSSIMKS